MAKRYEGDPKRLEKALEKELRLLHPMLFQHFSNAQLERMIAAMPLLRTDKCRWLLGSAKVEPIWPQSKGRRTFLLLAGRMAVFLSPHGLGARREVRAGTLLADRDRALSIGEDEVPVQAIGSAVCIDACILGVLSQALFEKAFADRAMGNSRIAQTVASRVPTLTSTVQPEALVVAGGRGAGAGAGAGAGGVGAGAGGGSAVVEALAGLTGRPITEKAIHGLRDIAQHAIAVYMSPGEELQEADDAEEYLLVVGSGHVSVRADVQLTERLECMTPRKARLRLCIERAEQLAGESLVDKLDPYVVAKLGNSKQFQTPVRMNAGRNATWGYSGAFVYEGEEHLELLVLDRNFLSADTLCGAATVPVASFGNQGWNGKVELHRPKRGFLHAVQDMEDPAGTLHFTAKWDFEPNTAQNKKVKERCFPNEQLFLLQQRECWGHESIMLGPFFKTCLCRAATENSRYALELSRFRLVGSEAKGGGTNQVSECWKVSRQRFVDFLKLTGRDNIFMQDCRNSSLQKQAAVKGAVEKLLERWEHQERNRSGWQAELGPPGTGAPRPADTEPPPKAAEDTWSEADRFRAAHKGKLAGVAVRSAANLPQGGWFSKPQPYAVLRFSGSRAEFRTSVLQDVGGEPVWDCEGTLLYGGESLLEIGVLDYSTKSEDEIIATGTLGVEEFFQGFEGAVPLRPPEGGKRKKGHNAMSIVIGILWTPLQDARGSASSAARRCSTAAERAPPGRRGKR